MLTPSVAVSTLETMFPFVAQPAAGGYVSGNVAGKVAAAVSVVDAIPDSLIVLDAADHASLIAGLAELRSAVEAWQRRGNPAAQVQFSVFRSIYGALRKCPDRAGAGAVTDFAFIGDPDLERDLAMDLTEVNASVANGEWKSATVVAGSIVEAVLLWEHQQDPQRTKNAIASAVKKKLFTDAPPSDLLHWTLYHCIEIAREAALINDSTATLARLTKNYRNLIHPGRAARLSQKPDRSTALTAAAAADAVIRDIRARHV